MMPAVLLIAMSEARNGGIAGLRVRRTGHMSGHDMLAMEAPRFGLGLGSALGFRLVLRLVLGLGLGLGLGLAGD